MSFNVDLSQEGDAVGSNIMDRNEKRYRFAIVPKSLNGAFFPVVDDGCVDQARKLGNVECVYVGTEFLDVEGQAHIIRSLVSSGDIDGIAVSIAQSNSPVTNEAIQFGMLAGIPVITFDSDAADSERLTYIGTNNYAFGQALGKVLLQIDPTGGYYGVISTLAPNAIEREQGLRDRLKGSNWIEHDTSPVDCVERASTSIDQMRKFASFPQVKAVIPIGGWPMGNTSEWQKVIDDFPTLTTVAADTLPHQMRLLNRGYVDGLVGQVPYQMGAKAVDVLLAHSRGEAVSRDIIDTPLQEIVTVPIDLPEAVVDNHYIGNLQYLGFTFSVTVVLLSVFFASWTFMMRKHRVVRASQPQFLIMIAVGAAIMGSTMIPMSFDDGNQQVSTTKRPGTVACMSSIWLLSIGFTTVFSALFSKTWRINKIWHNPSHFSRVTVSAKDVMGPFLALMFANVVTLSLMTALAPMELVRHPHLGTDDWNRIISTYGTCESTTGHRGGSWPYYAALLLINVSALIVANVQAYQARSIQSEFSESHYIAIAMASMLQTFLIAGPVLFLVGESPETDYVLKVCVIFIVCMVTLLCMFVPKIVNLRKEDARLRQGSSNALSPGAQRRTSVGMYGLRVAGQARIISLDSVPPLRLSSDEYGHGLRFVCSEHDEADVVEPELTRYNTAGPPPPADGTPS